MKVKSGGYMYTGHDDSLLPNLVDGIREKIEKEVKELLSKCEVANPELMQKAATIITAEVQKASSLDDKLTESINKHLAKAGIELSPKLSTETMKKALNSAFGKHTFAAIESSGRGGAERGA